MSDNDSLTNIIEALIFSSGETISVTKLAELVDCDDKAFIIEALETLEERYKTHVLELKKLASGYRFQVRSTYSQWVRRLFSEKPQKYSRSILETLAIIAYRQPVTRADIEAIRGVAVSTSVIRTLLERNWVKIAGHRDVPGRPAIYITTKTFLDYFNLSRLDELPSIELLLKEQEEANKDNSAKKSEDESRLAKVELPVELLDEAETKLDQAFLDESSDEETIIDETATEEKLMDEQLQAVAEEETKVNKEEYEL